MRDRSASVLFAAALSSAVPAFAQQPCDDLIGNGYIGVFADLAGTQNCIVSTPGQPITFYIIAVLGGATSGGMTTAEFRVEVPSLAGLFLSATGAGNVVLGNPLDDASNPNDAGGCDIAFSSCQGSAPGDHVLLYTVIGYNASVTSLDLVVKQHRTPNNPSFSCPRMTQCDADFTAVCLTPTATDLGRDPVAFRAYLRSSASGCPPFTGCPPTHPLGIYANATATDRKLCAAVLEQSTFYLVGLVPNTVPVGVTGAEFRIEVANPTGYIFAYDPPDSTTQVLGTPFDLTPADSTDPAGATILFPSCRPAAPSPGDLVDFGRIRVLNLTGSTTMLRIRRAHPGSPSMHCPRFLLCDAPFYSGSCMLPLAVPGTDIVFEDTLEAASSCVPPPPPPPTFETETLQLDLHVGSSGAITVQVLDHRQSLLISIQGTGSLTSASSWFSGVVCGFPERQPMTASPGVTNGWVGTDAEVDFAAALLSGGDCNTQGALGHHPRFEIDLGDGFQHMEPMGGAGVTSSPGHVYRYLVQGRDHRATFRWVETTTSDDYGVLTITVEQVDPTDVAGESGHDAVPGRRAVAMLPNVPDPFNPSTRIRYVLARDAPVAVEIFDIRGDRVRRLFAGSQSAGLRELTWDGRSDGGNQLPSGVYVARISSGRTAASERLVLVK